MNWKAILNTILHAAIGAIAVAAAQAIADPHTAFTAGNVLLPAAASAATSVAALVAQSPIQK